MKKVIALVAALTAGNLAHAGNCAPDSAMSIKDIAVGDPANFSTLVAAVAKAGLVDFLDGNRNLTVFAPTNEAFDATAKVALEDDMATGIDLVHALPEDALTDILKYHIAPGERDADDVLGASRVRMLNRDFTFPSVDGMTPFINGSEIVAPNVFACNGVVHVIHDGVLLPPDES
jgi:uncharacterized surface protein with fasciclin (FAS1) repeats